MWSTRWRRAPAVVAAAAAILAALPAAWWLIGDQSSPGFSRSELDYAVTPPNWSDNSVRVVGVVAVGVMVVASIVFGWMVRDGRVDRRWTRVVIVLVVDAAYVGLGGRVATAGVIGANLGLVGVFFGGVPLGLLTAWGAVARTLTIVSERPGVSRRLERLFAHFR